MYYCPLCNKENDKSGYCSECNKVYQKKWYQKNLKQEREKNRLYSKKYRETHKVKCSLYQKQYQKINHEKYLAILKRWRKKNTQKIKEYNKEYGKKNKEKQKIWTYAFKNYREKMLKEIGQCEKCSSKEQLELHHKVYDNKLESIMLLCRSCHRGEHPK